jgi:HlyD family secretion protein
MKRYTRPLIIILAVLLGLGAAGAWYLHGAGEPNASFKTAPVTRGDLLVSIDAAGTLQPEQVVDVGAQVAGQIVAFGTDADGKIVDYGSRVEQGTVLARIDEALFQADVQQAEAQVSSAQAGVQVAEARITSLLTRVSQAEAQLSSASATVARVRADLEQLKARLAQAQRDWDRARRLGPSEALAQASYDAYQSAWEVARANVAVGEASLRQAAADEDASRCALAMARADVAEGQASLAQAKAVLAQAQTSLWRARRNLAYCTIVSPVKGVIIDRRVNIGQTVVASLSAPSLFLIAKDLSRMQVWVAVNEADVARIYPGQPVTFTVDALPEETFRGEVVKLRLNASMTQNVVTYTVEIVTDNSSGRLLPYLTANVKFEVARRDKVLLVPSAALRWTPTPEQVLAEFRGRAMRSPNGTSSPAPTTAAAHNAPEESRWGVVYTVAGRYVKPTAVRVGLSSGAFTEVAGDELAEGMLVVTGTQAVAAASGETSNPFTPKLPAPPRGGPPR